MSAEVVIITGLSGSGKTVALRAIEDLGFFSVDNLPVSLIGALISARSGQTDSERIAVGIDIRGKEFLARLGRVINTIRKKNRLEIIFLEAETEVLIRRFKETRRPHPLGGKLETAILAERESLAGLRQNSDRIIDTSSLSPHQLRSTIASLYATRGSRKEMTVTLLSFGFKYGVPINVDLVFDVRFLPNPNFVPSLKHMKGTDKPVAEYVFKQPETITFMKKIKDLLDFLLPLYIREGRTYLSIAVGCTGGNHRSPAIVEALAKGIKLNTIELNVVHREIT